MPKFKSFLKYWLPVLLWMAIIFSASSDSMSFQRTSGFLAPIIRWLFPHMSEDHVFDIVFIIRKCAHLTEYAVLALLVWRALRKPLRKENRPWDWADARFAVLFVALYAASDEFHQLFVPNREGRFTDVLIDTSGGIIGLCLLWGLGRFSRKW